MAFRNTFLVSFALLFLYSEGQLTQDIESCPAHLNRAGSLIPYNNRCYDFVTYEKLSWNDARSKCMEHSGRLAEIPDATTLTILRQYMATLDNVGKGVWIGFHDENHEGTWTWVSGAPTRFTNWGSEQPGGFWGSIDDCALMALDGYWYDYACDVFFEHFSFVCEYDMVN